MSTLRTVLWLVLATSMPPAFAEALAEIDPPRSRAPAAGIDGQADQDTSDRDSQPGDTRVYRSVDKDGTIRFSDRPEDAPDAEEVNVPRANTVTITPTRRQGPVAITPPEQAIDVTVRITSPADGAVLQNPTGAIPVQAAVSPALPGGYRLQLLSNGQKLEGMALPRPDRGAHALVVQVLDEENEVVAESPAVTIQVHRPSRLLPPKTK